VIQDLKAPVRLLGLSLSGRLLDNGCLGIWMATQLATSFLFLGERIIFGKLLSSDNSLKRIVPVSRKSIICLQKSRG
jgi:hypothetical protein